MEQERPICGAYEEKHAGEWVCSGMDMSGLPVRCKRTEYCCYQEPKIYEK
jgi:hypothetical protein